MKNKIYHIVGAVLKYNRKIPETEIKSLPLITHMHDRSLSWFYILGAVVVVW